MRLEQEITNTTNGYINFNKELRAYLSVTYAWKQMINNVNSNQAFVESFQLILSSQVKHIFNTLHLYPCFSRPVSYIAPCKGNVVKYRNAQKRHHIAANKGFLIMFRRYHKLFLNILILTLNPFFVLFDQWKRAIFP